MGLDSWDVGDDYECISLLGTGSYGSVWMGKHRRSGKQVAIKQIKGVFDNETDCKRILREIKLLRRLDHPYIIKLYDIVEPTDFDNFNDLYLVLELADSDLKKVLKSGLFLTPVHIKTILYNLLWALYYIHSAQVLHRDLKPANVLVDESCAVKLWDFGLARSIAPKLIKEELKEEIDEDVIKASKAKQAESLAETTPNSANSGQNTVQNAHNGKLLGQFWANALLLEPQGSDKVENESTDLKTQVPIELNKEEETQNEVRADFEIGLESRFVP